MKNVPETKRAVATLTTAIGREGSPGAKKRTQSSLDLLMCACAAITRGMRAPRKRAPGALRRCQSALWRRGGGVAASLALAACASARIVSARAGRQNAELAITEMHVGLRMRPPAGCRGLLQLHRRLDG